MNWNDQRKNCEGWGDGVTLARIKDRYIFYLFFIVRVRERYTFDSIYCEGQGQYQFSFYYYFHPWCPDGRAGVRAGGWAGGGK